MHNGPIVSVSQPGAVHCVTIGMSDRGLIALGMAAVASVIGGVFSLIVFIIAAPLLAAIALKFRPQEYFALTLFGLSMLAAISGTSALRNLIAGAVGVLLGTVGVVGVAMGPDQVQGTGVVRIRIAADPGIPPRRGPVRC